MLKALKWDSPLMNNKESKLRVLPDAVHFMLALALAAAVTTPTFVGAGLFTWVVGLAFCHIAKIQSLRGVAVITHVNLMAIGVLTGASQPWSMLLALQLVVAALATLLLTAMLARLFYSYWIPVFLWPSIIIAWCIAGVGPVAAASASASAPWAIQYDIAVIAIFSLFFSPIFAAMLVIGAAVGWLGQSLFPAAVPSLALLELIAQSLAFAFCATVFLMPGRRSMAWSIIALCFLNLFLSTVGRHFGLQFFALNLVTWSNAACTLAVYGAAVFNRQNTFWSWRFRPEQKLDDLMTQWARFRTGEARAGLPFKGQWLVSQGFDGRWTHRGIWRHGIDFVVSDDQGKTFANKGFDLADYYAFGKDVLAPTSGYVVAMSSQFPDNAIGTVNNQHNFGNYVLIRDAYGAHVLIAHLMKSSVTCALYQYVEAGQAIGRCGNSGYSPEPHIHMHLQADAVVGSPTIPFHLTNFMSDGEFHFHAVPTAGKVVSSPNVNETLARHLSFEVDEVFLVARRDAPLAPETRIENRLDPMYGGMYFTDGEAKLYHSRGPYTFCFYRYEGRQSGPLYDLMCALPRVPLVYGAACRFYDLLPIAQWKTNGHRWFAYLRQIILARYAEGKTMFSMRNGTLEIIGSCRCRGQSLATLCVLDPMDGFAEFAVGERKYEIRARRDHDHVQFPGGNIGSVSGIGEDGRAVV